MRFRFAETLKSITTIGFNFKTNSLSSSFYISASNNLTKSWKSAEFQSCGGNIAEISYDYLTAADRYQDFFATEEIGCIPISLLEKDSFSRWFDLLSLPQQQWLCAINLNIFKAGNVILIPNSIGTGIDHVGYCIEEKASSPFFICSLFGKLPTNKYKIVNFTENSNNVALSWALSAYSFRRYKSKTEDEAAKPKLLWPKSCDKKLVSSTIVSTYLVRDLISTPAEDMGPADLDYIAELISNRFEANYNVLKSDDLLKENYKMIHAVGRAASNGREPRLLSMTWGNINHKKVTLIGKGVCFDTGGLDIKPSAAMLTMKKDMGGSAQVLGLAYMIMSMKLKIRLRVLIPAVENNISGNSFRPGDILTARNGKTTEIGNTDAEGRLILSDCLVEASKDDPDLIVDCATLTGAARVALGTDIPVMFCNRDDISSDLMIASQEVHDQVWRLPLWDGYKNQISSNIADIKNIGSSGYGGAITAALYLEEFIKGSNAVDETNDSPPWIHLDFMAFNTVSRPGRPEGGEAQGMRALYHFLERKYGNE